MGLVVKKKGKTRKKNRFIAGHQSQIVEFMKMKLKRLGKVSGFLLETIMSLMGQDEDLSG